MNIVVSSEWNTDKYKRDLNGNRALPRRVRFWFFDACLTLP